MSDEEEPPPAIRRLLQHVEETIDQPPRLVQVLMEAVKWQRNALREPELDPEQLRHHATVLLHGLYGQGWYLRELAPLPEFRPPPEPTDT